MIGDTPVGTIVTTHRHFDHWQALPEVQKHTGAVVARQASQRCLQCSPTSFVRMGAGHWDALFSLPVSSGSTSWKRGRPT